LPTWMSCRPKLLMKIVVVVDIVLRPRRMFVGAPMLCVVDEGRCELSDSGSMHLGPACNNTVAC
jgi:hypothetical protein